MDSEIKQMCQHKITTVMLADASGCPGRWAMQQVSDWLEKLGLGQYAQRFAENDISFAVLPDLTDQDLKEIGVSLGHRRQLMRAIAEVTSREKDTPKIAVAARISAPGAPNSRRTTGGWRPLETRQKRVALARLGAATERRARGHARYKRPMPANAQNRCVDTNSTKYHPMTTTDNDATKKWALPSSESRGLANF